jgi:hypothetical protein
MGNKQSIKWHQEGLANSERYLKEKIERRDRINLDIKRHEEQNAFSRLQIETAIKKGLDGFDNNRFMKKDNPQGAHGYDRLT